MAVRYFCDRCDDQVATNGKIWLWEITITDPSKFTDLHRHICATCKTELMKLMVLPKDTIQEQRAKGRP